MPHIIMQRVMVSTAVTLILTVLLGFSPPRVIAQQVGD